MESSRETPRNGSATARSERGGSASSYAPPLSAREPRSAGRSVRSSSGQVNQNAVGSLERIISPQASGEYLPEGDGGSSFFGRQEQANLRPGEPLSKKEFEKMKKRTEIESKHQKMLQLRKDDTENIKDRQARQMRLKDQKTEAMLREILGNDGLTAQAASIVDEFDYMADAKKQAMYSQWDREVAQRVEHQVMKFMNAEAPTLPDHFRGRELLHPNDDPVKSLIRQNEAERGFRKAADIVLLSHHTPRGESLEAQVRKRELIESSVANRDRARPMWPVPMWEQRQHYASSLGYFVQSIERGGPHHSARRMGTEAHNVDEKDGVVAAGKTKTRFEKHRHGILTGTVAKEGESRNYKRDDGHSSGAPCQDHFFYEKGNDAVEQEMPVGKRLFPMLRT